MNLINVHFIGGRWFVYRNSVEIDGPFDTKEAAYKAAAVHENRSRSNP
jgi:hypothetical protein